MREASRARNLGPPTDDSRRISWRSLWVQISLQSMISEIAQECMGVPDPAGVFPPGVAESVPAFLFFFFLRGMRAGGLITALLSDK